jgi:hypothetical protein
VTTDATIAPTTVDADALLEAIRSSRAEADQLRRLRVAGHVGHSDVASAEYRAALAVQRAIDAGVLPRRGVADLRRQAGVSADA